MVIVAWRRTDTYMSGRSSDIWRLSLSTLPVSLSFLLSVSSASPSSLALGFLHRSTENVSAKNFFVFVLFNKLGFDCLTLEYPARNRQK